MSSTIVTVLLAELGEKGPEVSCTVEAALGRFVKCVTDALADGVPTDPSQLVDFERELHRNVARDCVDRVVGAVIQMAHNSPRVLDGAMAIVAGYSDLRLQKSSQTVYVSLLGGTEMCIETPYYLDRPSAKPGRKRAKGRRGKEGNGVYPRLATLGIHYRASPALASEVARLVASGTVQQALDELLIRGIKLNRKSICRLAQRLAERGLAYRDWLEKQVQPRPNGWAKSKRLVIGIDGGRLRTRETKKGKRRASGRHGFDPVWREPKVFVIYAIDEKGRRLRGTDIEYDATLQDADRLFAILAAVMRSIGAHQALEWIVVGDGAEWIWNRLGGLVRSVGFDSARVTEVLDFYHASEYLHEVAAEVNSWSQAESTDWCRRMKRLMRGGQIERVLAEINDLCVGRRAATIRGLLNYLTTRKNQLDYASFAARGIPQGSGAVESAVRRIVNLRFKGNGIFWAPENVDGMLHLRAQLLAGHWDDFVRRALRHEIFWEPWEPATKATNLVPAA